jgi:hypothetical protein
MKLLIGFYAGLDSLILREIPFSSIQFPIYEYLKKSALKENNGEDLSFTQSAFNGASAGGIGKIQKCKNNIKLDFSQLQLMWRRPN